MEIEDPGDTVFGNHIEKVKCRMSKFKKDIHIQMQKLKDVSLG